MGIPISVYLSEHRDITKTRFYYVLKQLKIKPDGEKGGTQLFRRTDLKKVHDYIKFYIVSQSLAEICRDAANKFPLWSDGRVQHIASMVSHKKGKPYGRGKIFTPDECNWVKDEMDKLYHKYTV